MNSKLKQAYQNQIEKCGQQFLKLQWEDKMIYASWLAQTYNFVCHSTRIVALAGAHFPYGENEFHLSAIEHLNQEKNHEKMLVMDLKQLGMKLSDLPLSLSSSILFQNQYFWIQNRNPIAVYGYYLLLEGIAAEFGSKIYERLKKTYPEKTISFVRVHAEEDVGHIDEHLELLEKLNAEQVDLIIQNLEQSGHIYQNMLREIVEMRRMMSEPDIQSTAA